MPSGFRLKDFVFTYNLPEELQDVDLGEQEMHRAVDQLDARREERRDELLASITAAFEPTYVIVGLERGEQGRWHCQGFVAQQSKRGLDRWMARWRGIHVERRRGRRDQARDYCRKEQRYVESGSLPEPAADGNGGRSGSEKSKLPGQLLECMERIKRGERLGELFESYPVVVAQYGRRLQELYTSERARPRCHPPDVVVFWGPTGTGKSRRAYEELHHFCASDFWVAPSGQLQWFDGFTGHRGALFDDYAPNEQRNGGKEDFRLILRLLDRYPFTVPVKGAFVQWNPKYIYITSNFHPVDWFPTVSDIAPLLRRIHVIEKFE